MSLKNIANSRIYKKRKSRDLFLAEECLTSKPIQNHDTIEKASDFVKNRYKPLKFAKESSTTCSSMYAIKESSKQHKEVTEEVTVIPESDIEGEGEGKEETPLKKLKTMAERFQPKVKLTDIIVLYSDESDRCA